MEITRDWDSSDAKSSHKVPSFLKRKLQSYQQRNTPERRRERIEQHKLEYEEESLKTKIKQTKQARKGSNGVSLFGNMGSSKGTRRSSGGRRQRPSRRSSMDMTDNWFSLGNEGSKSSNPWKIF